MVGTWPDEGLRVGAGSETAEVARRVIGKIAGRRVYSRSLRPYLASCSGRVSAFRRTCCPGNSKDPSSGKSKPAQLSLPSRLVRLLAGATPISREEKMETAQR